MLAIFVGTILGLILQPLPTAAVALVGLGLALITGTMAPEKEAFSGFGNPSIWLIVSSFFIAQGFVITGLGRRMALVFISKLGKSSLGLAYGMAISDLVLAPATPSNTARLGGVLFPIITSLSRVHDSTPDSDVSRKRLGAYLSLTANNVNAVTSSMFATAMAGNPIILPLAASLGITITWGGWALAALVPGLLCLLVVPWLVLRLFPPTVMKTPEAPAQAREELQLLGRLSGSEWVVAGTFLLLLVLWSMGTALQVNATAAAFVGVSILLVTKVLSWRNLAENQAAWSTLIFFAVLVGMASQLNALGVIDWIGGAVASSVTGLPWMVAVVFLALVYFYVHYIFASEVAQIVALYVLFVSVSIAAGAPAMLAALIFAFLSGLAGAMTHYASGPAALIFGSGYVKTSEWFRVSFLVSVAMVIIWLVAGGLWWKLLGIW
jgi:DASS family divalent anion:Na+ symporter